jgi:hypothetical protein
MFTVILNIALGRPPNRACGPFGSPMLPPSCHRLSDRPGPYPGVTEQGPIDATMRVSRQGWSGQMA